MHAICFVVVQMLALFVAMTVSVKAGQLFDFQLIGPDKTYPGQMPQRIATR